MNARVKRLCVRKVRQHHRHVGGQKLGHSEFLRRRVASFAKNIGTLVPATPEIGGDDGLAILASLAVTAALDVRLAAVEGAHSLL